MHNIGNLSSYVLNIANNSVVESCCQGVNTLYEVAADKATDLFCAIAPDNFPEISPKTALYSRLAVCYGTATFCGYMTTRSMIKAGKAWKAVILREENRSVAQSTKETLKAITYAGSSLGFFVVPNCISGSSQDL